MSAAFWAAKVKRLFIFAISHSFFLSAAYVAHSGISNSF